MRVLVATDGSPSAGLAVGLVATIPWPEGSTVRVVEAVETGPALFGGPLPSVSLVKAEEIETELWRIAVETVEAARATLVAPGVDVSAEVLRGRPARAIVDVAGRAVGPMHPWRTGSSALANQAWMRHVDAHS
jgi:nucleotide-binding universal stress UspA family protein